MSTQSQAVKVADAVAYEMANATFTLAPVVGRTFNTELALEDAGTLHADVAIGEVTSKLVTRNELTWDVSIDIAVRKRFVVAESDTSTGAVDTDEVDRLLLLMQEVYLFFVMRRLSLCAAAGWTAEDHVSFRPLWVPEHLRELRQFTGILSLKYQINQTIEE